MVNQLRIYLIRIHNTVEDEAELRHNEILFLVIWMYFLGRAAPASDLPLCDLSGDSQQPGQLGAQVNSQAGMYASLAFQALKMDCKQRELRGSGRW